MHQPSQQPSKKQNPIHMTIEQQNGTPSKDPASCPNTDNTPDKKHHALHEACELLRRRRMQQGGFIRNGLDGARYHLMETAPGIQALQVFTAVGSLAPIYINQQFFDSLINDTPSQPPTQKAS